MASIFDKFTSMATDVFEGYVEGLKKSSPLAIQNPKIIPQMRKTWTEDINTMNSQYGFKYKLTTLTDRHKLLIYLRSPIVSSIVMTRKTDVVPYSKPWNPDEPDTEGFYFVKCKDKSPLTKDEQATVDMLCDFINNCGLMDEERERCQENMSFTEFMLKTVPDTYIYDALATEFAYDHKGDIHHFLPVSGATVRFASGSVSQTESAIQTYGLDPEKAMNGEYKYCQVQNDSQIIDYYTYNELELAFRNPVNDFFTNGYPISELDLLMNVVSSLMNVDNFKRSFYSQGITSPGIINIKGESLDDEQLEGLRRSWVSMGLGSDAAFKTPIISAPEGVEFIKVDHASTEIQNFEYSNYLIKLICAIYQISPEEIGFNASGKPEGTSGNSRNYSNMEQKIEMSKNRGLRPLLTFYEDFINNKIMTKFGPEISKKFKFKFMGLDAESKDSQVERLAKETKAYKTVNEARREQRLPPLPGCDYLILDPTYFQFYSTMSPDGKKFTQEQEQQAPAAPGGDGQGVPEDQGQEQGGGVSYVDQDGNPIDPSQIDSSNYDLVDENGNKVDEQGNPVEGETNPEEPLPFDEHTNKPLPFEGQEEAPESKGNESQEKLPFEE